MAAAPELPRGRGSGRDFAALQWPADVRTQAGFPGRTESANGSESPAVTNTFCC